MKVCVTSTGNSLDAAIDPRFGRCQYFIIVDTETGESEILDNGNKDGMGGVGIQAGQMMAEKAVTTLLSGNVGPNAFKTLQAAGIEIITGVTGTVKEAIEQFKSGALKKTDGPSVDSHFGTK